MSIKVKINLLFLVLGIISAVAISGFNYYQAREQIFQEALERAEVISSFAMAARNYTVKTMRPIASKIAGPGGFHPELMGGFFVARAIADDFAKAQPGYVFKQATLNPVNSQNRADMREQKIIEYFAAHRGARMTKGTTEKDGRQFFYVAHPVVAQAGCLKCHDTREAAPPGRVARYPGDGGYGYKTDSVVATFINYVPIEKSLEKVKFTAMKTAFAGVLSVLVILVVVWAFISVSVTRPLVRLTEMTDQMSRGKGLEKEISYASRDEIGALYDSFERMRKSVVKLIKIIRQKR